MRARVSWRGWSCLLMVVTLWVAPTANAQEEAAPVDRLRQPIINGEPTSEFPYVGQLHNRADEEGRTFFCSCVLIHPRYVLTAAHCIERAQEVGLGNVQVIFADGVDQEHQNDPNRQRFVDLTQMHPDYIPDLRWTSAFDIGVMRLNQAMEVVAPVPMADQILPWGEISARQTLLDVTAVGFGYSGQEQEGEEAQSIRRMARLQLRMAGAPSMLMTLPHPDTPEQSPCYGDSGGGLFQLNEQDEMELIGITAATVINPEGALCDGITQFTRVDTLRDGWIPWAISGRPQGCDECPCAQGCRERGNWCDPGYCDAMGCAPIRTCVHACNDDYAESTAMQYIVCHYTCTLFGTPHSVHLYSLWNSCVRKECLNDPTADISWTGLPCAERECVDKRQDCMNDPHGPGAPDGGVVEGPFDGSIMPPPRGCECNMAASQYPPLSTLGFLVLLMALRRRRRS